MAAREAGPTTGTEGGIGRIRESTSGIQEKRTVIPAGTGITGRETVGNIRERTATGKEGDITERTGTGGTGGILMGIGAII